MRELDKADKANDAACRKVHVERPGTWHIYSTRDQDNHAGLSEAIAPSSNAGWFQLVGSSSPQDGSSLLGAKGNLHCQRLLLQWVLEQVPLIEAELNEPKVAEGGSRAGRGRKRSRLHQDDQATDDWRPTKRKRGEPGALADDMGSSLQARRPPKRGHARPLNRLRNDGQDSASHNAVETSEIPKDPPPRAIETSQPQAISQQPMPENGTNADAKDLAGQTLLRASRDGHGLSSSFVVALELRLDKGLLELLLQSKNTSACY
ncbi:hypothetical protein VTK56DRAFT_4232 [Thermocarpiscus australiensis]